MRGLMNISPKVQLFLLVSEVCKLKKTFKKTERKLKMALVTFAEAQAKLDELSVILDTKIDLYGALVAERDALAVQVSNLQNEIANGLTGDGLTQLVDPLKDKANQLGQ